MVYNFVSSREVVARLVRNTRIADSSYFDDLDEWMVEVLGMLQTKYQFVTEHCGVQIRNHVGLKPCGLVFLYAVIHDGCRMDFATDERDLSGLREVQEFSMPSMGTEKITYVTKELDNTTAIDQTVHISRVINTPGTRHSYKIKGRYIQTTFKEGEVEVHYASRLKDEDGFYEIPDNQNYKEACYWYLRAKLIGVGWEDINSKNSEDTCMQKFEFYGGRAMAEITYPTIDQMQRMVESTTRLIPPMNYWEVFFNNANS